MQHDRKKGRRRREIYGFVQESHRRITGSNQSNPSPVRRSPEPDAIQVRRRCILLYICRAVSSLVHNISARIIKLANGDKAVPRESSCMLNSSALATDEIPMGTISSNRIRWDPVRLFDAMRLLRILVLSVFRRVSIVHRAKKLKCSNHQSRKGSSCRGRGPWR